MAYGYAPLPSPEHIRLLLFEHDGPNVLKATSKVVCLNESPHYICLSYTWGCPRTTSGPSEDWDNPTRSILLNGIDFPIRRNLYDALRALVANGKDLKDPIWIDAICINQAATQERNVQVALMSRIFTDAQRVVVWLGEEDEHTMSAISSMSVLSGMCDRSEGLVRPPTSSTELERFSSAFWAVGFTEEEITHLVYFHMSNVWFSRVWTLQEMILARELKFICGHAELPVECMWRGASAVVFMANYYEIGGVAKELPGYHWPSMFCAGILTKDQLLENEPGDEDIAILVHSHRRRKASDPRDKIYGLFGLLRTDTKSSRYAIEVNYDEPVASVFSRVGIIGLECSPHWDYFSAVEPRDSTNIPNLPSWVPDFTQDIETAAILRPAFCAAASLESVIFAPLPNSYEFRTEYHDFDTIIAVCPAISHLVTFEGLVAVLKLVSKPTPIKATAPDDVSSVLARVSVADHEDIFGPDAECDWNVEMGKFLYSRMWRALEDISPGEAISILENPKMGLSTVLDELSLEDTGNWFTKALETGRKYLTTAVDLEIESWGFQVETEDRQNWISKDPLPLRSNMVLNRFCESLASVSKNRAIFRTTRGHLGIGPKTAREGDLVGVLRGAKVPHVFRQKPEDPDSHLRFVGEAYVYGIMYGELLEADDPEFRSVYII